MKNGCPKCEKLPNGVLCDECNLGQLWATAEIAEADYRDAMSKYVEKLIKYIEKLKNEKNKTHTE